MTQHMSIPMATPMMMDEEVPLPLSSAIPITYSFSLTIGLSYDTGGALGFIGCIGAGVYSGTAL